MDRFRQICDIVELRGESKRKAPSRTQAAAAFRPG
jgi:hypothetical protein